MKEDISVFAFESGPAGGSAFNAVPAVRAAAIQQDPELEEGFETVEGYVTAPGASNNLEGPYEDERFCLKACHRQENCCGVVTIPAGYCWLKKSETKCQIPCEQYPGAVSYIKSGYASMDE